MLWRIPKAKYLMMHCTSASASSNLGFRHPSVYSRMLTIANGNVNGKVLVQVNEDTLINNRVSL